MHKIVRLTALSSNLIRQVTSWLGGHTGGIVAVLFTTLSAILFLLVPFTLFEVRHCRRAICYLPQASRVLLL